MSVAEAFVTIRPKMDRFGSELSSGVAGSLSSVGESITRWSKRAFLAAGVAGAATLSASLVGGVSRLLDTEDAVVSFRRLGLSQTNIDQLTSGIDQALAGTTVSNPQGFQLAGRLLAAGVDQAGIPEFIGTIADLAQVGNREFSEMADVLVRAQGQGRITAAELNRLGDVPLGRVAEEMGLTEAALRGLVSEGGLTAEAFLTAFAAVEEFNGAAKDETTRQAFSNLRTAISRMGASFLSPLFGEGGTAHTALLAIREGVERIIPVVGELGERFAGWLIPTIRDRVIPAFRELASIFTDTIMPAFDRMRDYIDENRDTFDKLMAALGPAVGIVAGLGTSVYFLAGAFRFLVSVTPLGIILAVATGLVYAWQNSEKFREVVTTAFEAVRDIVGPIVERLVAWVSGFGDSNSETAVWVKETWEQIQKTFAAAFEFIEAAIGAFVEWFEGFWEDHGETITLIAVAVWELIKDLIDSTLQFIEGLFQTFTGLLTGDWEKFWEGIGNIAESMFNKAAGIIEFVFDTILAFFGTSLDDLTESWGTAWSDMRTFLSEQWEKMKDAVIGALDTVVEWFAELGGRILSAIKNPGTILEGAGREIISGLWTGMSERWERVRGWVSSLAGTIQRLKGPLSYDKVMLRPQGKAIIGGLADSMESEWARVEKLLAVKTAALPGMFSGQLNIPTPPAAAVQQTGGVTINGPINVGQSRDVDELRYAVRKLAIETS